MKPDHIDLEHKRCGQTDAICSPRLLIEPRFAVHVARRKFRPKWPFAADDVAI